MDVLEVSIRSHGGKHPWQESVIRVNGTDLLELVQRVEKPFAKLEGNPQMAGAYVGIPADMVFLPSRHLLDTPDDLLSDLVTSGEVSKPALLMCECGEPGCWPFCARVAVLADVVWWSDFEQPHRTGGDPGWRYDDLGPFIFDRTQYEAALTRPITPP